MYSKQHLVSKFLNVYGKVLRGVEIFIIGYSCTKKFFLQSVKAQLYFLYDNGEFILNFKIFITCESRVSHFI